MIDFDAIQFLRRVGHMTSEAGLHVNDGNAQCGGCARATQCAVGVANDNHRIRMVAAQCFGAGTFDCLELFLPAVRPDAQKGMRAWDLELPVQERVQLVVVVLTRVDGKQRELPGKRRQEARRLDYLRSCTVADGNAALPIQFSGQWTPARCCVKQESAIATRLAVTASASVATASRDRQRPPARCQTRSPAERVPGGSAGVAYRAAPRRSPVARDR